MAAVWQATLEQVKAALDSKETARNNAQLARLIGSSTDSIEKDQLHRRFYPEIGSRSFDWPTRVESDGSRTLALGEHELVSVTALRVNGVVINSSNYVKLPVNGGPPYTSIELDSTVPLTGSARRAVAIDGTFYREDGSAAAGALATSVADGTVTTITVSDSAAIGTGQLLLVGTERMIVDRRSMADTGQNLGADIAGMKNVEVVPVGSGTAFVEGELVLIDAEKMLIVEVAGNSLVVKRGWDGSTIAAHTTGADVYAPRKLTVRRGVLGTSGASHTNGAAITKLVVPDLVNQLCIAETLTSYIQENTGYGRKIGAGDSEREAAGAGIEDLRRRAWEAYGRTAHRPSSWNADDGL